MGKHSKPNYGIFCLILGVLFFSFSNVSAQNSEGIFENLILKNHIKTVLCANANEDQSFPMITLGGSDRLNISFDDLKGGIQNYYYTIEHCTKDWKSSHLQVLNYVQSFNQDRINTYEYSQSTTQKYTHYSFSLPNDQVAPKISGNYILKVMEDGDPEKVIFTQRFFVLDNRVNISLQMQPSPQVNFRAMKQKINFTINTNNLPIQNPYQDMSVLVMQNRRSDKSIWNTEPRSVSGNTLTYDLFSTNDFFGGNEFRLFDLRSLRRMGVNIAQIEKEGDSLIMVQLNTDQLRAGLPYSQFFDNNGNYFIRINDFSNPINDLQADYATVFFNLQAEQADNGGDVYVVGLFNNYNYTPENKMFYDAKAKSYYLKTKIKQGVYDYEYVYVNPKGESSEVDTEGSFFATSNTYQALVYFRRPSSRYDELVGYGFLNTDNSTGRNL